MTDAIATMKAGMRALAAALLLLGTAGYAGAQTASSSTTVVNEDTCMTEWEESYADRHCNVTDVDVKNSKCELEGDCSVSVITELRHEDADGNYTHTTLSSVTHEATFDLTKALADVDGLELCLAYNDDYTAVTATVKDDCSSDAGEVSSITAQNRNLYIDDD